MQSSVPERTVPYLCFERVFFFLCENLTRTWLVSLFISSLLQNLKEGFKPKIKRMQNLAQPKTIHISESGVGLLTHNTSEYEMGRLHRPESFVTPHNDA